MCCPTSNFNSSMCSAEAMNNTYTLQSHPHFILEQRFDVTKKYCVSVLLVSSWCWVFQLHSNHAPCRQFINELEMMWYLGFLSLGRYLYEPKIPEYLEGAFSFQDAWYSFCMDLLKFFVWCKEYENKLKTMNFQIFSDHIWTSTYVGLHNQRFPHPVFKMSKHLIMFWGFKTYWCGWDFSGLG